MSEPTRRRRRRQDTSGPDAVTPPVKTEALDMRTCDEEGIQSLTLAAGEETYCPRQYHSFRVGGHSVTLTPRPGESPEELRARGFKLLREASEQEFAFRLQDFQARYEATKR